MVVYVGVPKYLRGVAINMSYFIKSLIYSSFVWTVCHSKRIKSLEVSRSLATL